MDIVVIGSNAPQYIEDHEGHIISAGYRECADIIYLSECKNRIEGKEIYSHRAPQTIKNIHPVHDADGYVMSLENDILPKDPDMAVLNLALLCGATEINIIGFRPPRDKVEDEVIGNFLMEFFPHVNISSDTEDWGSFIQPVKDDDFMFENVLSENEITNDQGRAAIVCCYRAGGDYDACPRKYVDRLYKDCNKHISNKLKWDMYVITDCPAVFRDMPVQTITMASNLEKWHCKFEIFRTELWENYATVICLDLDTAIVGDLNPLIVANIEFGLLSDIYHPERPATGIIVFRPDPKYRYIYEKIMEFMPDKRTWDVYPLLSALEELEVVPERLQNRLNIGSWKKDLHDSNGQWIKIPHDMQIIVWHGRPRPHQCNWELPEKENPPKIQCLTISKMKIPKTIYVIGGGPSLKNNNPDDYLTRSDNVIGCNDAYQFACASSMIWCDNSWYRVHRNKLRDWAGEIWTTSSLNDKKLHHIQSRRAWLSDDPNWIAWNACTGWAALNFALLRGADRIVMMGYDMDFDKNGNGNYHKNIRRLRKNAFKSFCWREGNIAKHINQMFPNVEIVVCNPTKLTRWTTMSMADAVAWGRSDR